MANKVFDTKTFKIYNSLKELCFKKKLNYTYLSRKLSEKIINDTNYIYVKEINFSNEITFLDKNKKPFDLLHYFELIDGQFLAVVKTMDKNIFILNNTQIEKYPFEITKKELDVIIEFLKNRDAKYLYEKFKTSIAVIDRIILKYSRIDFNLIKL